jgi:hypothetical protein
MKSRASPFTPAGANALSAPERSTESGALPSVNVGGGARWFAKRRLAFTFDLRFHIVSGRAATETLPPTPRTTLAVASAGIALR